MAPHFLKLTPLGEPSPLNAMQPEPSAPLQEVVDIISIEAASRIRTQKGISALNIYSSYYATVQQCFATPAKAADQHATISTAISTAQEKKHVVETDSDDDLPPPPSYAPAEELLDDNAAQPQQHVAEAKARSTKIQSVHGEHAQTESDIDEPGSGEEILNEVEGQPKDLMMIMEDYQQAAAFGDAKAQYELGSCYENGKGC